jgi:deoxyhypusine synthase
VGDFKLEGESLRKRGLNRIGNLISTSLPFSFPLNLKLISSPSLSRCLVPNNNYCLFEDWLTPILHTITDEQINDGTRWTPSRLIHRLGKEINHPESVYYWCYKNNIPVYCPAITDGSLGDMLYFHSYKRPELMIDLIDDIRSLNDSAAHAACTGMVILGGGIVKHHTCNANLMRNGAEYSVYINTGQVLSLQGLFRLTCDRNLMAVTPEPVLMRPSLGAKSK